MKNDDRKWVIYHTKTGVIWNRFYLEEDARKKLRRILRQRNELPQFSNLEVDYIDGISEKEWKMWKKLLIS